MNSGANSPNIKKDISPNAQQYMMFTQSSLSKLYQSQSKNLQKSQVLHGSEFTDPKNQKRQMVSELFVDNLQQSFDASCKSKQLKQQSIFLVYQDISQMQLQDQYQSIIIENDSMKKQISQSKQKIDELQEELKKKDKLILTMESGDQEQKNEEIQKLQQQIKEQAQTILSLEQQIISKDSNLKLTNDDNQQKIHELLEEIEKKKEIIKQWVENLDESNFKVQIVNLTQANLKLNQQLKKVKYSCDKLKGQLNEKTLKLQNSIFTQEFLIQNSKTELIQTKNFLKKQIVHLEKNSKTKQDKIEELLEKEKSLNQEHYLIQQKQILAQNELNIEIQMLKQQLENLSQNEKKLNQQIDNLQNQNKKLEKEYEIVKEEWQIAVDSKEQSEKRMEEKVNNQMQVKDQEIQTLQVDLRKSNESLDQAIQQVKILSDQIDNLNKEINSMKLQLIENLEKITEVNQQNELLSLRVISQENENIKIKENNNTKIGWLEDIIKEKNKQIQNQKEQIEENKQNLEQINKIMEEKQLLLEELERKQIQLNKLQSNDNKQSAIEDNELKLKELQEVIHEKEKQLLHFITLDQKNESDIIDLRQKYKLAKTQQSEEREYQETKMQKLKLQFEEALDKYDKRLIYFYELTEKERNKSNQFQSKLQVQENELTDTKNKLEQFKDANEKLNQEIINLVEELVSCKQKLREDTKSNKKFVYESQNALNKAQKEFCQVNKEKDLLKEELETKTLSLNLEKEQNEKLLKFLSELELTNQEIKIQLAREKTEQFFQKQTLEVDYQEQLKQKANELSSTIQLYKNQVEDLIEEKNNFKQNHKELKRFWREQNQELMKKKEKMEEQITNLQKEIRNLHTLYPDQLQSNQIDQIQFNSVQKENQLLKDQLSSFKEVEKQNYLESEKQKKELNQALSKIQKDLQQQQNESAGLKSKFEKIQKENQQIQERKAQLDTQIQEEYKKNKEMEKELKLKIQEFNQAQNKIGLLEGEIENLQNEINLIIEENYNFTCQKQEKIDQIEDEIEQIKKNVLIVKTELTKLMKNQTIDITEMIKTLDNCCESLKKCNSIFSIISKTELPEHQKKNKVNTENKKLQESSKLQNQNTKSFGRCLQF